MHDTVLRCIYKTYILQCVFCIVLTLGHIRVTGKVCLLYKTVYHACISDLGNVRGGSFVYKCVTDTPFRVYKVHALHIKNINADLYMLYTCKTSDYYNTCHVFSSPEVYVKVYTKKNKDV